MLTTLHLIQKCGTAFLQSFLFRMPQINQITIMGQDIAGIKREFLTIALELADAFLRQRFGYPLPLILCEQGECIRTYLMGINGSYFYSTTCTYVRSNIFFHICSLYDD